MIRRYIAEFVGTFAIVFAPVALSATGAFPGSESSLMAASWVSGLAVLGMIYALGHISAAHFNPAVTIGFAVARRFPWRYVLPYVVAQLAGGIAAATVAATLFGGGSGVHHLAAGPPLRGVMVEALLTFFLMLVILGVATDKRANGAVPGIAIGLTVVFDVLIGGPLTGGSMNPARSFGPAVVSGVFEGQIVYWIGPIVGAIVAALLYDGLFLRRGKDPADHGAIEP